MSNLYESEREIFGDKNVLQQAYFNILSQSQPAVGSPCKRCPCSTGWNPAEQGSSGICQTCGHSWNDHL